MDLTIDCVQIIGVLVFELYPATDRTTIAMTAAASPGSMASSDIAPALNWMQTVPAKPI